MALPPWHPRVDQRHLDIGERGQSGQQVEGLEDEANVAIAGPGEPRVAHRRNELAVQSIVARGRRIQAADHVHQRRLAGTRRAHDRRIFVLANGQIDAIERMNRFATHLIGATNVRQLDNCVVSNVVCDCVHGDPAPREMRFGYPTLRLVLWGIGDCDDVKQSREMRRIVKEAAACAGR